MQINTDKRQMQNNYTGTQNDQKEITKRCKTVKKHSLNACAFHPPEFSLKHVDTGELSQGLQTETLKIMQSDYGDSEQTFIVLMLSKIQSI